MIGFESTHWAAIMCYCVMWLVLCLLAVHVTNVRLRFHTRGRNECRACSYALDEIRAKCSECGVGFQLMPPVGFGRKVRRRCAFMIVAWSVCMSCASLAAWMPLKNVLPRRIVRVGYAEIQGSLRATPYSHAVLRASARSQTRWFNPAEQVDAIEWAASFYKGDTLINRFAAVEALSSATSESSTKSLAIYPTRDDLNAWADAAFPDADPAALRSDCNLLFHSIATWATMPTFMDNWWFDQNERALAARYGDGRIGVIDNSPSRRVIAVVIIGLLLTWLCGVIIAYRSAARRIRRSALEC
jgi:hypothetical protein